jgi:hypothetical protein
VSVAIFGVHWFFLSFFSCWTDARPIDSIAVLFINNNSWFTKMKITNFYNGYQECFWIVMGYDLMKWCWCLLQKKCWRKFRLL